MWEYENMKMWELGNTQNRIRKKRLNKEAIRLQK